VPTERKTKSSTPSHRREVDVVLDRDGEPEPLAQVAGPVAPLEAGDVRRQREPPGVGVDDAGNADHGAVEPLGREAARRAQHPKEPGDRVDRALGVGAVELDVLARPDLAAQVTDRAAEKVRADVEAEDEPGFRHDVEERRAVRRASRLRLRLAHEARVQERLERERDGRLRDPDAARDLCAGDRRRGPDRVEDGALVEILQKRGKGSRFLHLGRNLTPFWDRAPSFRHALDMATAEVQGRVSKLS
jgi:hypothetical protein